MRMGWWIKGLTGLLFAGSLLLIGCAAQQQASEPTPEEIAARQDSIAKANEFELKKNRMFAYDKIKQGDWVKAREYLWKVAELDVKHEYNDWHRIYQSYMETNLPDSARFALEKGLEYHPEDPYLNATYGYILKAQGQNQEALEHYDTALKSEPENIDYLRKKAELHEALGQPEDAISTYEKIVQISPEDAGAKASLTALIRTHRDPAEYIAALERDVESNPDDLVKRMDLLRAYQEQSQNDKVVSQADEIIQRDPTKLEAYRSKGRALENLNRLDDAVKTYENLLAQDPANSGAMLRIADDLQMLKRFSQARQWILKAKSAAGGSLPEADYILALVYESAGDACAGGGLDYDDKLVYTIAQGLFKQVAATDDYNVKAKAASRATYLEQFVPAKSDWFLNQTKQMPQKGCYSWINAGWPETAYIKTFLSRYSG